MRSPCRYRAGVPLPSRVSRVLVSFALAMLCMCVVNFLAQIVMIFLDVVTRLDSSSAAILALGIAIAFAATGHHGGDPLEFSLMFTNVWVVIAHFFGVGAMALVLRLACDRGDGRDS